MTEMVNGDGQGSSNFAGLPVTPSSTPSQAPAEERTFKQSDVNEIASRRASEAVERYKRETSMASHNYQPPQQQQYQPPQQQQQYAPPPPSISQDEIKRLAQEEFQRSRSEWEKDSQAKAQEQDAQRIASEFFTKVGAGEGGIQEFEKVIGDAGLDLRAIPYHVQLANMVENTKEVMIELAKNPSKIGAIQNLIDIDLRAGRQPRLALTEMKRLSESIKSNKQAANFRDAQAPLSQLRPSNAGTDNKGPLTVSDYKRKYRV